jgi:hypothetical protein
LEENLFQTGLLESGAQFIQRAFGDYDALVDDDGVGTEAGDVIHEVGGEEHGYALLRRFEDDLVEEVGRFDIESVGGLIEHEQFGLVEQGEEQAQLLLHTARIIFGIVMDVFGQSEAGDGWREAIHGRGHVETVHGGAELQDFAAGETGIKDRLVGEKSDEAHYFDAFLKAVVTVDLKYATGGFEDAHEEAEEGSFASAIGAEQAADLAGRDGKRDIVERCLLAEGFPDAVDADQARAGRFGVCRELLDLNFGRRSSGVIVQVKKTMGHRPMRLSWIFVKSHGGEYHRIPESSKFNGT